MSPRRRLLVAGLAVVAVLAAVAALAAGLARPSGPGPLAPGETPVLVVPGYNGTPASVGTLAARLRAAGRRVVVVDLPDRGTGDLRASATALAATSATAQLLHRAGLFLGDELLEALPSNPYGHFEDNEVVALHHQILADNDMTWLVDEPFVPVVDERRWQQMRQLVECRNTEHRLWGFKDPRACLFLALWKYLLPNAKVLLVYRHFSGSTRWTCCKPAGRRRRSGSGH